MSWLASRNYFFFSGACEISLEAWPRACVKDDGFLHFPVVSLLVPGCLLTKSKIARCSADNFDNASTRLVLTGQGALISGRIRHRDCAKFQVVMHLCLARETTSPESRKCHARPLQSHATVGIWGRRGSPPLMVRLSPHPWDRWGQEISDDVQIAWQR